MKILNERGLVHFANSGAPADKEGYLHKKGELNKGFQRRWFVLKGNLLFYYEHKADLEPVGVIILEGCTIELAEDMDGFAFLINFGTNGARSYCLSAKTQEEMESWMKVLSCAGYDYVKLMVSELQSKLEEVSDGAEARLISEAEKDSQILGRMYNTDSYYSSSKAEASPRASASASYSLARNSRVNPFNNLENSTENDPGDAFRPMSKVSNVEVVTWSLLGVHEFSEMHEFVRQQLQESQSADVLEDS
ncbi:sesquipedalian-1-like [Physella acuta]|uniref:sesquipedalian-1-like n=1 Tax=Physella acuta TaxID=109671 RepID=UPI0027DB86AF|nr:sesquipedalian-1-like [Physella acuta]